MAARELWTGWETVTAVDIDPDDLRAEWARAQQRGGGYPLAVSSWERKPVDDDVFSRFYYGDGDPSPAEVIERAAALTAEDALAPRLAREREWEAENWDEILSWQLDNTRRRVGRIPEDFGRPDPDQLALERRLLAWEEDQAPTKGREDGGHIDWFTPDDPCSLLLLPITQPEHAVAYVSFYGADGEGGHERLIAILRSWRERFGAHLVANWGTMLQFLVVRPPRTLEAAFALAVEQSLVAPSTLSLPGVTVRDHARALLDRGEWLLHERP